MPSSLPLLRSPHPAANSPEIVIVDDDTGSLSELEELVSELGHPCQAFTVPERALNYVRDRGGPVVLLSDVRLPGMSGLELSRVLRDRDNRQRLEIVLFSGGRNFSEAIEALKVGIGDFLIKPIDRRQLERTIAQACERLRERRAVHEQLNDFVAGLVENAQRMVGGRRWCLRPNQSCQAAAPARPTTGAPPRLPESLPMLAIIKLMQTDRRTRDRLFPSCAAGDAAWQIILFVFEQQLLGRPVSITSACHATTLPQTTALRKIDDLVEAGQLCRVAASNDRRRVLLKVTPAGEERIMNYIEALHAQISTVAQGFANGKEAC